MNPNPIFSTIPFDKDGVHHGFLKLPYSRNDSAWGAIMIPIAVIRNGDGPTALLTGANHGDEYEGTIALQNLALQLKPRDICGRVIIVPAFNYPAFRAGCRNSPYDDGNMNRVFPGNSAGNLTEKIADYFSTCLVPMASVVVDIHAGGKTLEFVPLAAAHVMPDKELQRRCIDALLAFNAPNSMLLVEPSAAGMYDTTVEEQGKTFVTTELGGGGTTSPLTLSVAKRGIRNILIHAGILDGEISMEPTVGLDMPDENCYLFSEHEGLIEPVASLGDTVEQGDPIAKIWPLDRTGVAPFEYRSFRSGMVVGRHFPGLVQCGDCLAVFADVVDADSWR